MEYSLRYKITQQLKKLGFFATPKKHASVKNMINTINKLDGKKIIFELEFDKDGNWAVESTNISGIVTGGNFSKGNVSEIISDAIFTYFEIPPQYCDESILVKEEIKQKETRTNKNLFIFHQPAQAYA